MKASMTTRSIVFSLLILLIPSIGVAVDDATVQAIESKASSANAKADGNNSRIQALETDVAILQAQVSDLSGPIHEGAIYRWAVWSTYNQGFSGGWYANNDPTLFGGVYPSQWSDGYATASDISSDKEVLRTLFTRKGYAGDNALVVADEWASYSSTNSKLAGALFRIKNTTAESIVWNVQSYQTAYSDWGERASIALNGVSVWNSTGIRSATAEPVVSAISIPPGQTSTVIFVSSSTPPGGTTNMRGILLGFKGLNLPPGLEFVDDLDTATGGWDQ